MYEDNSFDYKLSICAEKKKLTSMSFENILTEAEAGSVSANMDFAVKRANVTRDTGKIMMV